MKLFLKKTSVFIFGLFIIFVFLFFGRVIVTKMVSWKLPNNTHILFMGASHVQAGINPSFYNGSINIASSSERYMFTFLKLKELIKANHQIDTVYIQFAPTDIHKNTDTKYFQKNEMLHFLPLYSPLFTKKEWNYYLQTSIETRDDAIKILINKMFSKFPTNINSYGGFTPFTSQFDREKEPYNMPVWLNKGSIINYHYLNEIIRLCDKNNIELFFIYMPMYNKYHFYDIDYFYKQYKEHFKNVKLLDYSDWTCSDSLRKDEHHLNKLGAENFTKKLKTDISFKARTHNNVYKK
jgi:hypothetical protein